MEEKQKDTKSDHIKLFEASLGHTPDLKVSIKTEPRWTLESESKFDDCASLEAGNHSQDIKQEDSIVLENLKCDIPGEPQDLAAHEDTDIDNLTESKRVDTASKDKYGKQDKNVKRMNTNDHPLNKKVKCEMIEDMIEEETAVFTASIVKKDNVSPAGAIESKGDAGSTIVPLPTKGEELRTLQNSLKGKKCQKCGLVFAYKAQRKKHQATHTVMSHHCVLCNKWFEYLHEFVHHKLHPKHVSKCTICGIGFTEVAELAAHQHLRHRQKCLVCGLVFATKREKKKHQATHTPGEKTHQCAVCNKWFELLREFETHTRLCKPFNSQGKEQNVHMCTLCGVQFSEMEDLTAHLSVHPKLKCCICGVRLVTKSEKTEHKSTHIAGEKTHHCTLCNQRFEFLHDIENHTLLKHPNSVGGPHKCTFCGSSFSAIEDLNAHMNLNGKKCQVCGLTFATKGERKKHQADHPAGEKTHHCTECDMWFVTHKEVEIHTLLKHMDSLETPHKCNVCGKSFLYADALSVHKGKH